MSEFDRFKSWFKDSHGYSLPTWYGEIDGPWNSGAWAGWQAAIAAQPSPAPVAASQGEEERAAIEAVAKVIYEQWINERGYVPWVEAENSDMQYQARDMARTAIKGAALAPAAVVMPDEADELDAPKMSADTEPDIAWRDGYNACREVFASRIRRAIPAGLLERVVDVESDDFMLALDELRALLGNP